MNESDSAIGIGAEKSSGRKEFQVIGQIIGYSLGHVVIALQWVGPAAYRVSINRPGVAGLIGAEIDGASYSDEEEARAEARRMVNLYRGRAHVEIENRREELAELIETNERRYGAAAKARANRYRREADTIQSLRGRWNDQQAAAGIEQIIAANAPVDPDADAWAAFDRKLADAVA